MAKPEIEEKIKASVEKWNREHPPPEVNTIEEILVKNPEYFKWNKRKEKERRANIWRWKDWI